MLLEVLRENLPRNFPWCILGALLHAALSASAETSSFEFFAFL
jgi:hypothetical protein